MSTSKMKFRFKLTGLEIEMEGSREEVSQAATNFTNQLTGLIKPKGLNDFPNDEPSIPIQNTSAVVHQIDSPSPKKRKVTKQKSTTNSATKPSSSEALDTKFDVTKFGVPKQDWKAVDKALWTLYVLKEEANVSEMSSMQIVNTFNKHFKQAGKLNKGNTPRDLGNKKLTSPSLVGEDATNSPSKWYLTEGGIKYVQDLIIQQKSNS